ncbi:MAG: BTAD domain-containing putative transcriptional regulator [Desulforhopalus sp.]|jgi:ATP/maltotriose-dependent transcriptional regulator MalT|nr:BTAD domain-containing putative transcriptional regulator [Desulforhopalus sp.]
MQGADSLFTHRVPSNKFYPPHISQSQSLLRTSVLQAKLPAKKTAKKVIILEAQAGQGKTTLASQFLEYHQHEFIWYQIDREDSDPVFLLSSLLANLTVNLSGFQSPQLENILQSGSVGPLDLIRCSNLLLHDLDHRLKNDLYLVFDDLHLIEFGALTNKLLGHLIDFSPSRLRFILISRHPLDIKAKAIRDGSRIAYLNTADLALSDLEIEALYNTVLHKNISRLDAGKIQKITKGWVMGIILASHPISGHSRFWLENRGKPLPLATDSGHMLDYFQDEIFAQIPSTHHLPFLRLSFLREIPVDLAADVSGSDDFAGVLAELAKENYFIYHLDDEDHVFRFHHFFQEFLQKRGAARLGEEEIAAIYATEAKYYLAREMIEKALACYQQAGDLTAMENILREKGMGLIARNRTISILALLQAIPEETLFHYSWLTLYTGLLQVDFAPQTTLPFFERARSQFVASGDETGELIALSQIIYFYFVISGEYKKGALLLPRTRELLDKNQAIIQPPIVIIAARNLASGYCFFKGEMNQARQYINLASKLAGRFDLRNFTASSRFIQGYIELLCGNRAKHLREAEACNTLCHDPLVGESNRLTMRIMGLCYLSMTGDHLNFHIQQQALQNSINQQVVEQTVAAPYLFIWASSNLYSLGQPLQAMELLEKSLGVTATAVTAHMHSQILQWQAFGLALTGYADRALARISEASRLREEAGGPFYLAFHNIVAGAVYTRLNQYTEARSCLDRSLAIAETIPSTYLLICALFNRSYLKYQTEGSDAALEDLESGLVMMKINGYNHFWTWEPKMMTTLLALAVSRDIQKVFARELAGQRLQVNFSSDGTPIPLLRFTLMDSFRLSTTSGVLLRADDLTPFQRELLGLLVTAKGQRIPQEKIQVELWPESPPENARKSFDTLHNRLRKLLTPLLPVNVKNYIHIQKGILALRNFIIDCHLFQLAAQQGLSHSKNSDWWQAQNQFQTALSLWKGVHLEDLFRSEQVLAYNDMLSSLLVEMARSWAENLAENDRMEEAITLLEHVLRSNYLEEELTILLYRCYLENSNPLKARDTLQRYRKALLKAEYTEAEANRYADEIVEMVKRGGNRF